MLDALIELGVLPEFMIEGCNYQCIGLCGNLKAQEGVIISAQQDHFVKVMLSDGLVAYVQKSAAVMRMVSFEQLEQLHKLERKIDAGFSAVRNEQDNAMYSMYEVPLLLAFSRPSGGWFAQWWKDKYKLHFVCPVCGKKGATGQGGKGYSLTVTKEYVLQIAQLSKYTLQALEVISLLTPLPLPHLSKLADYLPSDALIGNMVSQLQRAEKTIAQNTKRFDVTNNPVGNDTVVGASAVPTAVVVTLEHVRSLKELLQRVKGGESIPPTRAGLTFARCRRLGDCAWVCSAVTDTGTGTGSLVPSSCQVRFESEGNACVGLRLEMK